MPGNIFCEHVSDQKRAMGKLWLHLNPLWEVQPVMDNWKESGLIKNSGYPWQQRNNNQKCSTVWVLWSHHWSEAKPASWEVSGLNVSRIISNHDAWFRSRLDSWQKQTTWWCAADILLWPILLFLQHPMFILTEFNVSYHLFSLIASVSLFKQYTLYTFRPCEAGSISRIRL